MYLLTKGTISIIRKDAAGVKAAQERGYSLVGECDKDGVLVSSSVVLPELPAPTKKASKKKAEK